MAKNRANDSCLYKAPEVCDVIDTEYGFVCWPFSVFLFWLQCHRGQGDVPESDVWSLGLIMYRILEGKEPFGGVAPKAPTSDEVGPYDCECWTRYPPVCRPSEWMARFGLNSTNGRQLCGDQQTFLTTSDTNINQQHAFVNFHWGFLLLDVSFHADTRTGQGHVVRAFGQPYVYVTSITWPASDHHSYWTRKDWKWIHDNKLRKCLLCTAVVRKYLSDSDGDWQPFRDAKNNNIHNNHTLLTSAAFSVIRFSCFTKLCFC